MISPLALPALLACASPDYSFYEVIPGSSGDALDAVGAEEVDFRNYCGTLTDPGGYANQPERILGSVWERPVECRENPTGGDCSFIPGYDNLDSSLLSRDSQEIEEEIYREWIHWDGSAGAGDLFDFFNINLQGGAVVEIVGVKTWVGSLFTDQGLDQAVDEFLDDYGSADWEQG